jgi:acyl carrier protein
MIDITSFEEYRDWDSICSYMELLLDDYEKYDIPIDDEEWTTLEQALGKTMDLLKKKISSLAL